MKSRDYATLRPLHQYLLLIVGTVAVGLLVRFAHLGLPFAIVKYGGSALWALTIYWIVSAALPARRVVTAALLSGAVAAAVEFAKLYHSPAMDAFRLTLPGILLLGRFFSVWDLVAYCAGIAGGAFVDSQLRNHARTGKSPHLGATPLPWRSVQLPRKADQINRHNADDAAARAIDVRNQKE